MRVKVCCIASIGEARTAVEHVAAALGLVSELPSGPGVIEEERIAEVAAWARPSVETFLLTSETDPAAIIAQHERTGVTTLQLCDRLPAGSHVRLRRSLPDVSLVQVVHVTGQESVAEALEVAAGVDALLLDSGDQSLPVKELGGTGRVHDWALSARIVAASPVPVWLAGGLGADNVEEAIRAVRPYGLDLCTGVRTEDRLDADKLADFMGAVTRSA